MTPRKPKPPIDNPRTARLIAETLALMPIAAKTEEMADCLIWTGATSKGGYPIVKMHGQGCCTVRRVLVKMIGDKFGSKDLAPYQPVRMTCDERMCIDPAHMVVSSNGEIARRAGLAGAFSTFARGAKIANARRAMPTAKLTMEKAVEIRLSSDKPAVLAERYGVTLSLIKSIRGNRAWRDYSSPFAGLGGRV